MQVSKRGLIFLLVLVFVLGVGAGGLFFSSTKVPSSSSLPTVSLSQESSKSGEFAGIGREKTVVKRVIDGDTIELIDGRKVRYIGIDTPESVDPRKPVACFAKEAVIKNQEFVLGKNIELEKDISETDRFGRLLRYVYVVVGETEMLVNEGLVREGFAKASTYPPDVKYQDRLRVVEMEAREVGRGLWGSCDTGKVTPSTGVETKPSEIGRETSNSSSGCTIKGNISSTGDKIYHLSGCGSYEKTSIDADRGERWFCTEDEAVKAGWRKAKNC